MNTMDEKNNSKKKIIPYAVLSTSLVLLLTAGGLWLWSGEESAQKSPHKKDPKVTVAKDKKDKHETYKKGKGSESDQVESEIRLGSILQKITGDSSGAEILDKVPEVVNSPVNSVLQSLTKVPEAKKEQGQSFLTTPLNNVPNIEMPPQIPAYVHPDNDNKNNLGQGESHTGTIPGEKDDSTTVTPAPEPEPTPVDPSPGDETNEAPVIETSSHTVHVGSLYNPLSYATATDKEDGDVSSRISVPFNDVDTSKEGTYTVTYQVSDSSGATTQITVNVKVINDAPVITTEAEKTLSVGESFDPMSGVTANDTEDGDLTSSLRFEGNVNTQVPGTYTVLYTVQDKQGKSTTRQVTIHVVNDLPVIHASDIVLHVGEFFDPLKNVTATDKQDGDLTKSVQVIKNQVDATKPGEYLVTYQVTDSLNGTSHKTITVRVEEKNTAPELTVPDHIFLKVGDRPDLLKGVKAIDKEDGDLTDKIHVEASHVDLTKSGEYTVVYSVKDKNGKEVKKEVPVYVENAE